MTKKSLSLSLIISLLVSITSIEAQEAKCIKSFINKRGIPQLKLVNTKTDGTCRKGSVLNSTGPSGATGPACSSGIIRTTTLNSIASPTVTSPDILVKAITFGNFTKERADSDLVITLNSHGTAENDGTGGGLCEFQLRVNDRNSDGLNGDPDPALNGGTAMLGNIISVVYPANSNLMSPVSMTGIFKNLSSGSHELSVWIKRRAVAICNLNSGNFTQVAHIQEIKTN